MAGPPSLTGRGRGFRESRSPQTDSFQRSAELDNAPADDPDSDAPEHVVEITTELYAGGSATAKIRAYRDGVWTTGSVKITVHDALGTMPASPGSVALVRFHRDHGIFILWQVTCP